MIKDEKDILRELLAFTEEEKQYQKDFQCQGKLYSLENHLTEPEQHVILTEKEFFGTTDSSSTHIVVKKHNRYNPEFWHTHEFFELIYVLEGKAENHLFGQSITLKKGDLSILSPSVYHSIWTEEGIILNILIKKTDFYDFFTDLFKSQNIISSFFTNSLFIPSFANCLTFSTEEDEEIYRLILSLAAEQKIKDEHSQLLMKNSLISVFSLVLRNYSSSASFPSVIQKEHETISKIMMILNKNYGQISLDLLSEKMGYAPVYCSRLIKQFTGQNYSALVKQIKFRQAEHYLKNTTMSIEKISELCGYENPEGFNRAFKQVYGIAPSRWRKL